MRPWRRGSSSGRRPFSASRTSWTASGRSGGGFPVACASRGQRLPQGLPAAYRSLNVPTDPALGAAAFFRSAPSSGFLRLGHGVSSRFLPCVQLNFPRFGGHRSLQRMLELRIAGVVVPVGAVEPRSGSEGCGNARRFPQAGSVHRLSLPETPSAPQFRVGNGLDPGQVRSRRERIHVRAGFFRDVRRRRWTRTTRTKSTRKVAVGTVKKSASARGCR